ncbi:MAG: oxaloacetate decarboxylase [Clostridiales bacterium]|nr:oxaloacetate decarboxylase [Clostridiales bacterium]
MGVGMLGVFLIVGIIIASTYLIGYVSKKVEEKKNNQSENQE